ncbi:MAG: hypothetical protein D6706_03115 [Chloroflexi bacterium]|nr:MAG: hypothetical protein D6706_03115 [Chloroflexota bacterium]
MCVECRQTQESNTENRPDPVRCETQEVNTPPSAYTLTGKVHVPKKLNVMCNCKRKPKISGMARRSSKTQKQVTGAGLAILAEWAADKFVGGVLTDQTGTIAKAVVGGYLFWKSKNPTTQGIGAGLAVNNGLKLATGKNLTQMLLPEGVAGISPYYRQINGTSAAFRSDNQVQEDFE